MTDEIEGRWAEGMDQDCFASLLRQKALESEAAPVVIVRDADRIVFDLGEGYSFAVPAETFSAVDSAARTLSSMAARKLLTLKHIEQLPSVIAEGRGELTGEGA